MRLFCALFGVLLLSWPAHAQQLPAQFLGEWIFAEGGSACRPGDFDKRESDSLIKVGRRQIEYWESLCTVQSATTKGNTTSVRMSCAGEGERWSSNDVLSVQKIAGRDHLISYRPSEGFMSIYARCR
jgi:hypothetical protein